MKFHKFVIIQAFKVGRTLTTSFVNTGNLHTGNKERQLLLFCEKFSTFRQLLYYLFVLYFIWLRAAGFKLNATIIKNVVVSEWIDCVLECACEPCCRSINYKKTLDLKNETNCEMLHDMVYNKSQLLLLDKNNSYDHVYLANPRKVNY